MADTKPSNPKDIIGTNKVPLHLFPESARALGAVALLDGALKYGRANWRAVGVRATIYYDALNRHMGRWIEGEDSAPDSGISHLGHALACLAILIDAEVTGNLMDDRQYPSNYHSYVDGLTERVGLLRGVKRAKEPKHYTIQDTPGAGAEAAAYLDVAMCAFCHRTTWDVIGNACLNPTCEMHRG